MLEGYIKVWNKFFEFAEFSELFDGDDVWIEVEESVFEIELDCFYFLQKSKQSWFLVEVASISGGVLCDKYYLFYSRMDHIFDLLHYGIYGERFLDSSKFWDDTEGTFVAASFRDFEVFKFIFGVGVGLYGLFWKFKICKFFA